MSSPKLETKKSVEQQVKAGLRAVRDFIAGRSGDLEEADAEDKATREVVAAELLARMSGRADGAEADAAAEVELQNNTQTISAVGNELSGNETKQNEPSENSSAPEQERERARQLFLDHGYFDEAVQALGTASTAEQRVAAARALGLVGSQRGTAHLVAAMFDDDPEVRRTAEEALSQIGSSTLTKLQDDAVLNSETAPIDEVASAPSNSADQGWENERAPWEVVIASAKSDLPQEVEQDDFGLVETAESESLIQTTGQVKALIRPTIVADPAASDSLAINLPVTNAPTVAEEQLLLEEHRIREVAEQLTRQLLETAGALKQSEQEVQSRIEQEARLRAAAAARRHDEEELRKRADEEAEHRRADEREALTAEQVARARVETEAQRLAELETRLRLRAVDLRLAISELIRQRAASENARREAAEETRQAEAKRARDEAKLRHDAELARLAEEEEALRSTADDIAARRAQVEAEREKADAEAERLVEAHARMQAAAEAGAKAEVERSQLEAEINQRMETGLQQLEETRRHGQEEQERLQEEARRHAEEERHRLAELDLMRTRMEAESRQLAEKEQLILSQVNRLRFADSETRKRIADAEARRRAAEEAYRLVAEKVQRVEAEAHARAKEEEQMLAKLEAERRTVAMDAQSRAAQEKRIREEIEMFRRLEAQERPRLEAATLQRTEAQVRLQQLRDRLKAEVQASADEELNVVGQDKTVAAQQPARTNWRERSPESPIQPVASAAGEMPKSFTENLVSASENEDAVPSELDELVEVDEVQRGTAATATPSIAAYLNSVDPYKRAAAVAELARSRSEDAFELITKCFGDPSSHVRNAAARAFSKLEPTRTVDLFNRALEGASDERRRDIGAAIANSGLASEAIKNLVSEHREDTYNALSMLFVMAKTGAVEPLKRALEEHPDDEIGKAVMKLLNLSGHPVQ